MPESIVDHRTNSTASVPNEFGGSALSDLAGKPLPGRRCRRWRRPAHLTVDPGKREQVGHRVHGVEPSAIRSSFRPTMSLTASARVAKWRCSDTTHPCGSPTRVRQ